jgi:hypothetical protein
MKLHTGQGWSLIQGDCIAVLKKFSDNRFDSIVCDPPYELGFMGKKWDASGIAYSVDLWREVLRVLKPGGHLLAFGGSRTYHRMTCAIEDAGFEVRDSLHWVYGTGFPKSLNVSKAIDDAAGATREVVGYRPIAYPDSDCWGTPNSGTMKGVQQREVLGKDNRTRQQQQQITAPSTEAAKQWDGWGTALKPAHEPIVMARKPLTGTVSQNVLEWGTGALNIDACRIGTESTRRTSNAGTNGEGWGMGASAHVNGSDSGRWPANILFDEDAAAELDAQSGTSKSSAHVRHCSAIAEQTSKGAESYKETKGISDSGGASRFFYVAKPSRKERDLGCDHLPAKSGGEATDREDGSIGTQNPRAGAGRTGGAKNFHPTVKPVELMRYLVRLVTPPGGTVLDPFAGSGTTGMAARLEGVGFIGVEREPEYCVIAASRIKGAA